MSFGTKPTTPRPEAARTTDRVLPTPATGYCRSMTAMTPLWLDRPRPSHPALTGSASFDVVVAGAGLTGLLTGLLLARAGLRVAVIEARRVGDGTSGHTTAKVSLLQGTRFARVLRTNPPSVLRDYVTANQEGQAWLRRFCEEHGVSWQDRPAYTYATTRAGELRARAELAAAGVAGLPAAWVETTELPFPVRGAVRLDHQMQLDPVELMDALTAQLSAEGGSLFENTRLTGVSRDGSRLAVTTEYGAIDATHVVLATGQPVLRRHGFFARLHPERSYAAALRSPSVPQGMYLAADHPTRSVRSLPHGDDGELLLVGGNGHVTGRCRSEQSRLDELVAWAQGRFGGEVTHTWSAQDQASTTGLPYVGPMLPGEHNIWVATGFDKWGLAVAPSAALLITKSILHQQGHGELPEWRRAFSAWTPRESVATARIARYNAEVGLVMAKDILGRRWREAEEAQPPLSGICTHLGGAVRWNDAERSWDCPLHGSRFAEDGGVLEGPAVCGLRRRTTDG